VEFEIPEELKEKFEFRHGQYVTLKKEIDGEEVRRNYSICSSPFEEELRVACKKVEGGRMSTYLNEKAEPGERFEVMEPMGNFYTELDSSHEKQYIAFAAGSGITPVISIIKTVLHKEPKSRFLLFYGNRTSLDIIFKHELEKLREKHGNRLEVHHVLSREEGKDELRTGRIDKEKAKKLLDEAEDASLPTEYFICGPEGMMNEVSSTLEERGIDEKRIHIELFTSPVQSEADIEEKKKEREERLAEKGEGETAQVTVILDDEESTFELDYDGDVILDAALEEDLDVPFSCKGAVCSTCRAKLVEGKVEMEENHALTDEEVEDGQILTCQSHPRTPKVVVDYDDV
jgi:ring-1,2-phenylacetyl-CoA epoxidase subunit PaaE